MSNDKVVFFADKCNIVNSECSPYNYVFLHGTYLLEVWSASGGNSSIDYSGNEISTPGFGGKGGYSKGILRIFSPTKSFLYVGEQGFVVKEVNVNSTGTFGGGGNLTLEYISGKNTRGHACIGGGASDIRLHEDNLFNRVLVAGAGGGASGGEPNAYVDGGDAGGLEGYKGHCDTEPENYYTNGGSQTSVGKTHGSKWGRAGFDGEFGQGGGSSNYDTNYGGSGGGGWFGGAGGGHRISGAGGSGYAFTKSSHKPSGFKLKSTNYLKYTLVLDGRSKFVKPTQSHISDNYENGHVGNGAVRITRLLNGCSCGRPSKNRIMLVSIMIVVSC